MPWAWEAEVTKQRSPIELYVYRFALPLLASSTLVPHADEQWVREFKYLPCRTTDDGNPGFSHRCGSVMMHREGYG